MKMNYFLSGYELVKFQWRIRLCDHTEPISGLTGEIKQGNNVIGTANQITQNGEDIEFVLETNYDTYFTYSGFSVGGSPLVPANLTLSATNSSEDVTGLTLVRQNIFVGQQSTNRNILTLTFNSRQFSNGKSAGDIVAQNGVSIGILKQAITSGTI